MPVVTAIVMIAAHIFKPSWLDKQGTSLVKKKMKVQILSTAPYASVASLVSAATC